MRVSGGTGSRRPNLQTSEGAERCVPTGSGVVMLDSSADSSLGFTCPTLMFVCACKLQMAVSRMHHC